jgi:hypothetical protein
MEMNGIRSISKLNCQVFRGDAATPVTHGFDQQCEVTRVHAERTKKLFRFMTAVNGQ